LTKSFDHGCTEAMRPATMAAKHLCHAFCNPESSADSKLLALRNAPQFHSQLAGECARGKGVDHHLFALKCTAKKYDWPSVPDFFKSEPWKMLNHTLLSTSNCGNPSLALFG
jgi:carnitine O-acetyltransferase